MNRQVRFPRTARLVLPAVLAAGALLLTACSGGDAGDKEPAQGPLTKYMNALFEGEEYTQETFDKQQLEVEELVAACMTKEGFEYIPNPSNGGMVMASEGESEGPEWGTEEFAKQYGYGIIDWPGSEDVEAQPDEDEYVDLNADYVNSLSESESAAYYEALHGPQPTEEEMLAQQEDENYEYNWEEAGCYGAANNKVQQESNSYQAASEDPQFADLFTAMNEVFSVVYDEENPHEDVAKLNRDWADCVAEAGLSEFTSPNQAQQALFDEYNELQSAGGDNEEYVEPSKADKKKFQEREVEVAVADLACKKKLSYDDKLEKLQFELEQKFVDEHKAELDAMIAQYGTAAKKD
ncbi:hypothetical protein [Leucobacter salsicius]|uniref:hypothetical protein n=1 Tax=Leucobacter salsicius TaxID=664638 RepID=UPI00034CC980|nr:hypothetical protein [Leucobacter salsicius]